MQARALLVVLGLAATTAACASGGASAAGRFRRRSTPPATHRRRGRAGEALGHRLAATALELRGVPYRNGGIDARRASTAAAWCATCFAQHGLDRAASDRARSSPPASAVDRDDLQAGDLVFFSTVAPGASHVGIAARRRRVRARAEQPRRGARRTPDHRRTGARDSSARGACADRPSGPRRRRRWRAGGGLGGGGHRPAGRRPVGGPRRRSARALGALRAARRRPSAAG